jgi:hypothetical protein
MSEFESEMDFIGDVSVKNMRCSMEALFWEVGKLRARLGDQTYLLDEYLTSLMGAVNRSSAYDAVSDGFEAISELRRMCRDIVRGRKRENDRLFYVQAEDFIGSTPLDFLEEQTKISLYTIMLSGNYIELMAERFVGERKSDLLEELDLVSLQKLRNELCEQLDGMEEMDRIDRLFRQSFMVVLPLACWLQGAADSLLGDLISQDRENDKLNFQLRFKDKV